MHGKLISVPQQRSSFLERCIFYEFGLHGYFLACNESSAALFLQCPSKWRDSKLHSSLGTFRMHSQQLQRVAAFPVRSVRKQAVFAPVASMEDSNPFVKAVGKIVGSLPVLGLFARIASDEGGVGEDLVTYADFFRRAENRCGETTASAFNRFKERHGKTGTPQFVLLWCWAVTVGAGLLKAEDLELGARRLRVSYDIQYEVEMFDALMEDATKRRKKTGAPPPGEVPLMVKVEKALDGICICCIGKKSMINEQDIELLTEILCLAFPSADKVEIQALVNPRSQKQASVEA